MKKLKPIYFAILAFFVSNMSFAQSVIVEDIIPGNDGSYPSDLKVIGNNMYFFYDDPAMDYYEVPAYMDAAKNVVKLKWPAGFMSDGISSPFYNLNGNAIWIQDVYDMNLDEYYDAICYQRNDSIVMLTGWNDSYYSDVLFVHNNKAYITYYVDTLGYELFSFDGTNFELVEDINVGSADSYPYNFYVHQGDLYFNGSSQNNPYSFFKYDGSTITEYDTPGVWTNGYNGNMVSKGSDLFYLSNDIYPTVLIKFNNGPIDTIYNQVDGGDYYSDNLIVSGNELYIDGFDNFWTRKLTKYNTTTGLYDHVATNVTGIDRLMNYNDTLFFSGEDVNTNDPGLYYLVPGVDTAVLIANGYVNVIESTGNNLYFAFDDMNIGNEPYMWMNDTIQLIEDLNNNGSYPEYFTEFNGQLIMGADDDVFDDELIIFCLTPVTAPTAAATQIACEGTTVGDLTVTGANLTYFANANGTGQISSTMVLNQSGTVYAVANQVCPSTSIPVPYTISTLPNTATSHYGNGYITVINPSASYQWMNCTTGDSVAGATNQVYQTPGNGVFQCIITNADGCSATSDCIYVVNLGVEENLKNNVSVYPNPAKEVITLQSEEIMGSVELVSFTGQMIQTIQVNATSQQIDLGTTSNGVYILNVYNQAGVHIAKQKVIVHK